MQSMNKERGLLIMTVEEISKLCDISEVMRVDKVVKIFDWLGNELSDSMIFDCSVPDTSFESNTNKDVFRLEADYDGNITALYTDGKTVFLKSAKIIVEEVSTENLNISGIGSSNYTGVFCNQRDADYTAIIYVNVRKYGDEEKALNELYEYTQDIATRFDGVVKFVIEFKDISFTDPVKNKYLETNLDKSWEKKIVKICDNEHEVFVKVFNP